MQQLQAAMQQMQQAHAQQMQQMQSAVAGATAASSFRAPSLRIAPPPLYNGTVPPLDEWTAALRQQFAFYGLTADADQIRLAAAHLRGPALDWSEHPGAAGAPATWAEFDAGLRARFQPVTTADAARARIFALEQGKHSVNDYVASFRRLAVALPTTDAETLMFQFRRGLHPSLRMHLLQAQPATLDAAIALAVRMGSAHGAAPPGGAMDLSAMRAELDGYDAEAHDGSREEAPISRAEFATLLAAIQQSRSNGSGSNGRGAQGASGGYHGPRGLPRIAGFSEEKVKRYMEANLCFGCESTEHRSRACPRRRIDPTTGKVSWSKN